LGNVDLVIRNGTIVTPAGRLECGIAVDEERISLIGKEGHLPPADSVIDAKGKLILPGMIDAHVHFRDPQGQPNPDMEDFASGTAGAAAGGITMVFDMPGTVPAVLSASIVADKVKAIRGKAYVDFGLYGGAGAQNLEDLSELAHSGIVAFKTFMIGGPPSSVTDDLSLFKLLEKVEATGLPCSVHAENGSGKKRADGSSRVQT
jgi:dihydroorotase-like cyclic amidohydrolase